MAIPFHATAWDGKNQEIDGYTRDKRPKTEKLKPEEKTITEN